MSSELERLDDLSPDESVGAFGGSGQWIEIGTVKDIREKFARIEALEAENARLREALELAAGALQAGQRSMAPRVAFTGDWAHLGTRSISDILDTANEALERRAREGGNADG